MTWCPTHPLTQKTSSSCLYKVTSAEDSGAAAGIIQFSSRRELFLCHMKLLLSDVWCSHWVLCPYAQLIATDQGSHMCTPALPSVIGNLPLTFPKWESSIQFETGLDTRTLKLQHHHNPVLLGRLFIWSLFLSVFPNTKFLIRLPSESVGISINRTLNIFWCVSEKKISSYWLRTSRVYLPALSFKNVLTGVVWFNSPSQGGGIWEQKWSCHIS